MHAALSEHVLANGLRVVLAPHARVPLVASALCYDVGSRNERPGTSGFAHLFEHMMFEGSEHVGKGEHFRWVHGFGGQANATTTTDRTLYFASLPSSQLPLLLWLEADRMRSLDVSSENLENQRSTVLEERRQRYENAAYGQASLRAGELSFGCWAYQHPVIGSVEDIEAATLEMVRRFHATWYRPGNAVLAIAGDFEPDEALELLDAWFAPIADRPAGPTPDLAQGPRAAAVVETLHDPLAQLPLVLVNHQAPPFDSDAFWAHEVLESVLFGGPSSRIYRRMVHDERIAVQVGGGYDARRGPSLFAFQGVVGQGSDPDVLVDAWFEELRKLAESPLPAQERERVENQLRAGRVFAQEGVTRRARMLAETTLATGEPRWEERYLERIAAVSDEAVMAAAAAMLPDNRVELRVVPGSAA